MTQNKMVQSVTGRHEKRGGSNFKGMAVRWKKRLQTFCPLSDTKLKQY
jgi:hypothetical protein